MNSNQLSIGTDCENKVISILRKNHYWVYHFPLKSNGSPCDIVCMKGDPTFSFLIDAKHVINENVSFPFDRIEPNQHAAMRYAHEWAGLNNIGFAILFDRDGAFRWLPYEKVNEMINSGLKSVNMNELERFEEVI